MQKQDIDTFLFDHFEGPLDLLWHLIHREEIDIYEVPLQHLIHQYVKKAAERSPIDAIDNGADFIGWAAALVWYKSRALLPKHEQQTATVEELETNDPRFEIIHQLIDYCRFKEAAKQLAVREQQQSAYYARGGEEFETPKKHLGINHLSLEDLAGMFQQLLFKAASKRGTVQEEVWKVSDKIASLRRLLAKDQPVLFTSLFTPEKSRDEWIVIFLALLELMKIGDVRVGTDTETLEIVIFSTSQDR